MGLVDAFIPAPNSGGSYTKVLLVVHDTEGPEQNGAARDVIAYWNRTRNGSTQYVIDNREIIQAVREDAYAWAAGTTANKYGIHVEHVGYASQRAADWADPYSTAELGLSARLFAELGHKHGIPLRRIGPAQIRNAVAAGLPGLGGICGHDDITAAFPGETSHTDPGPNFPWGRFIADVQAGGTNKEDDLMVTEDDEKKIIEILRKHGGQIIVSDAREVPQTLETMIRHLAREQDNLVQLARTDADRVAAAVAKQLPAGPSAEDVAKALLAEIVRDPAQG